jgi:hypothetical protein
MILSRSQPSIFLPGIMLVWGALSAVMAVSHTYGALLGFRFILGYARLLEFLLLPFY